MSQLLIQWASINSYSHNYPGLDTMLQTLAKDFSILPGKLEILPLTNTPPTSTPTSTPPPKALRITCRPNAPIQILLNGHMDTVYPPHHPFQKCTLLNQNQLQGPGVADMKGGLVILLEILKIFEQSPHKNNIGWQVLITPDEEIGSPLSHPLLQSTAKNFTLGLLFEPSLPDGSLARSRKGTGSFTAVAHGISGHSGRNFNKDHNAILGLCQFLLEINHLNIQYPNAIFNIGHIEGGGVDNVIPDHASARINVRISTPEEQLQIENHFKNLTQIFNQNHKVQIELSGQFTRPPKPPSPHHDTLFKKLEICAHELKLHPLGWQDTGGASDGNNLAAAGLPNIDNLGPHGNSIHSENEFIYLDSLITRTQLTLLFLLKLASGEINLPKTLFPNQN